MFEHLPAPVGHALRHVRPGLDKLLVNDSSCVARLSLAVLSRAFEDGAELPLRYTADGEGLSPPLRWYHVPPASRSIAVVVEDADSPTPRPLVHAIVWNLPAEDGVLGEGVLNTMHATGSPDLGRNSLLQHDWLPPDPPPGHGAHRYGFEVFALDCVPGQGAAPGRGGLLELLRGHVLASGLLVGTYERHRN
ncbi:YbhB/YbcL family Raf kinase inhibitor-like protein [Cognatiluteimonas telluris]|jgi:Raf kinase inhibitor-like YbhB/YbcL family protein|uniref:YbhB/YbcL family Raf kinase inhibitor-like protein n=1 Tax=Cognatiluteimonas telluris TaxID=1104775 RepID=UPI0014076720|nr:YbhB/YbcL family Raf kinase inhibitor-like protein [Lysobacter telluris]